MQFTALTIWLMNESERMFNHIQLDALLLVPEMLTMLDPPTFKGSPRYEVPTRTHIVWCGSPIRYDGPVAIIINICVKSCLLALESGLLCIREVRFTCLVSVSVTCVNGSFTIEGERVRVSPKLVGRTPNFSRNTQHNRKSTACGGTVHRDAEVTSHKGR